MLLLSEKLSADDALAFQFVSRVFQSLDEMNRIVWPLIENYSEMSLNSMIVTKSLMRPAQVIKEMQEANRREVEALSLRLADDEVAEAAIKFLTRKNKL